jgi:hypothetical protein
MIPAIRRGTMTQPGATSGTLGRAASGALAAVTGFILTLNGFFLTFNSARLAAACATLLVIHLVRFPQLVFTREARWYALFLGYLLLQLFWTEDRQLALNTIVPALAFLIVLVLVGSLSTFHDLRSVLFGLLAGVLTAATAFTVTYGFPLRFPAEFSYNAVAGMYLFGLFVTFLLITIRPFRVLLLGVASVLLTLTVATTSIKVNLGILAGVMVAGIAFSRQFIAMLRRHLLLAAVLAVAIGYAIGSNEALIETMQRGFDRVALGVEVLQARENVPGYSGFEKRSEWLQASLAGWVQNPLFGHGVEAFRARFGATSHSTIVDLLYNSGLIGLLLFYGLFASMLRRLYVADPAGSVWGKIVILGSIVAYLFISLSAPIHYQATFAAVLAVSAAMLRLGDVSRASA